jgi:hypothetical protein
VAYQGAAAVEPRSKEGQTERAFTRGSRLSATPLSRLEEEPNSFMADVRVVHDCQWQTLTVWFSDPAAEFVYEETVRGIVLIKARSGQVIGVEKRHFSVPPGWARRAESLDQLAPPPPRE